jgi:sortase A
MSWNYRRRASNESPNDWHWKYDPAGSAELGGAMTARRVVGAIGRLLIGFGVVVLLFVVYLLWGTGLFEASHQNALRQQFNHELARTPGTSTSSTSPGATTTTTPLSGVQQAGVVPPEGQPVGILDIPKIGVDKVVVEGTGTADLHLGPGHYPGTPLPGQPGNAAIAGHRTTYGAPFYNLNELQPGDPIYVTTTQGRFLYKVTEQLVVSPSDVSVVAATQTNELTLTTCNPRFSAAQRLVIHASLMTPAAPAPKGPAAHPKKVLADGLAGEQGSWVSTVAWGLGCLALAAGLWLVARRWRHRLVVYGVGVVPMLVLLFFFYQNVSPLLPASF